MADIGAGGTVNGSRTCPSCGRGLVGESGYVAWCEACRWNVAPDNGAQSAIPTRLGRFVQDTQQSMDRSQEHALQAGLDLSPRGWRGWLALLLAIPVHATGLAFAACGLALLVTQPLSVYLVVVSVILVGVSAALYTVATKSTRARALGAEESEELRAIVDEVRHELGAPRIRRLRIDREFNASVWRGWLGNELTFGWPLWCATTDVERLGIIGHEVAHLVNGDVLRRRPLGLALRMLTNWHDEGQRMRIRRPRTRGLQIVRVFVGWVLAHATAWYRALILKLMLSQSQRAEYRADLLAARAVGTSAVVAGLTALPRDSVVMRVMRTAQEKGTDPWKAITDRVASLPPTELRRLALKARAETAPTPGGDTHPPLGRRIAVLEAHEVHGQMRIDPGRWRRAERQMSNAVRDVAVVRRAKRRRFG